MSDFEKAKEFFMAGLAHQQQGELSAAETAYRQALEFAPDRPSVLTNLIAVMIRLEKYDAARPLSRRLLSIEPNNKAALVNDGLCAHAMGDFEAALQAFDAAVRADTGYAEAHLNRALSLAALQRFQEALDACNQALALRPGWPEALVNRGTVLQSLGRSSDAIADYGEAIRLRADYVAVLAGRSNALRKAGKLNEALLDIDHALRLDPAYAEAWDGRGSVLRELRHLQQAVDSHTRALQLRPTMVNALSNRANALAELNEPQRALEDYERALQLAPDKIPALIGRADMLSVVGRIGEAQQAYQLALAHGADPATMRFYLAGLGVGTTPAAPPAEYVAKLFDAYAPRFEHHLTRSLKYQVPQLLSDAMAAFFQPFPLEIVDLGCGTGLMAPLLRPRARILNGVDLSPGMIERARARKLYDTLEVGELVQFLMRRANAYDVAAAADVLVYIGDLQPVFVAARHALRSGGLLGFSVEATEEGDYVLQPTRRYAHSSIYIERLAAQQGFRVRSLKPRVLRLNENEPIHGYIAVLGAI